MLTFIKLIHTIIWVIMAVASLYILYAGLTNTSNMVLVYAILLLALETLVLIFNRWTCPLTPMAKNYTSDRKDNFDIYLPNWLAKYNKIIFGGIFVTGLCLIIIRML
jgi:hypothetical protein